MKLYYRVLKQDKTWSKLREYHIGSDLMKGVWSVGMLLEINTKGKITHTFHSKQYKQKITVEIYHPRYPSKSIIGSPNL